MTTPTKPVVEQVKLTADDWKMVDEVLAPFRTPYTFQEWARYADVLRTALASQLALARQSDQARTQAIVGGEEADVLFAPQEPTDDMVQAGLYQLRVGGDEWAMVYQIWKDMFDTIAFDGGCTSKLPMKFATQQPLEADVVGMVERLRDHPKQMQLGETIPIERWIQIKADLAAAADMLERLSSQGGVSNG